MTGRHDAATPRRKRFTRRTFLVASATATGGLLLGYRAWVDSFATQAATLVEQGGERLLAGWVTIAPDDAVTVYVPHVDMGQGVHTALAMMLAEELDADWSRVRTQQAPAEKAFANAFLAHGWVMQGLAVPSLLDGAVRTVFAEAARFINLQQTGGSTAVRLTGQAGMRLVGAAARQMLVEAAARRWSVDASTLTTRDSVVTHAASNRQARYGELVRDAAQLGVPTRPPLKPPSSYRLVGTSVPRLDIPKKVTGEQIYAIDLTLPDMRVAAVRAAPVHGGRLERVDPAPAMAVAGVERVLSLPDAVAVVATGYWPARQGLLALRPQFSDAGHGAVSTEQIERDQLRALEQGEGAPEAETRFSRGNIDAALDASPSARAIEATYHVPFLHHAPMEPPAAVAQFVGETLTAWTGDQNPLGAKRVVSQLAQLDPDRVTIVPMPIGGSFGRRGGAVGAGALGYLAQSIALARQCAPHPVKVIWDREEDFAQGAYRPQLASRLRGAVRADGRPILWSQIYADGVPSRVESFENPYDIPHQLMRAVACPTHVRVGSWRSVNHTQHGFWAESFIDELAQAAGADPFEYRRMLLPDGSRHRRVLEAAAEQAGWRSPLAPGVGRGIAIVESYGSIVAEVIEASLDAATGRPRVHRIVAAVDCGGVCHPDTATQQVEGAIVMGLSAALGERITIAGGAVAQKNFPQYPLLTMAQTPRIEVRFVASEAAWGGLGEPALPPVAPALANALAAATGRRFRRLPFVA